MRKNSYDAKKNFRKTFKVNEYIRAREVTVIDEHGAQLGVMPTIQAIALARERELDLVEVSPLAQPPVAKILNFGQLKYQQSKTQQKAKKVELKTVKISFKMGQHDLDVRQMQIKKFLDKGHKVNVSMRLKGREKAMKPLASDKTKEFINAFENINIEKPVSYEGGQFSAIISKK